MFYQCHTALSEVFYYGLCFMFPLLDCNDSEEDTFC